MNFKRLVKILCHALGIATILLMFYDISTHGYFIAEDDLVVRTVEILLAIYALAYFLIIFKSETKKI